MTKLFTMFLIAKEKGFSCKAFSKMFMIFSKSGCTYFLLLCGKLVRDLGDPHPPVHNKLKDYGRILTSIVVWTIFKLYNGVPLRKLNFCF
jgi:hypothetical protein